MEQYFQDGVLYLYTKDVFLIVFTFPTFLFFLEVLYICIYTCSRPCHPPSPPMGWVPPLPPVVMAVVVGGW